MISARGLTVWPIGSRLLTSIRLARSIDAPIEGGLMSRTTDCAVVVCSTVFIVILGVAAYWDPTIRVLHVFEAVPYGATAVLCLRRNRFGYPLGVASGAFC